MLKALEMIGFKSFADKTRFEFPPGITVVVGPNGSGKSNVVDAMKWVLGAQSAKALRGNDMADVIFKGSAEGGRKMLNAAEATIVFDNAEKRLPVDATEVHVTRRVYRSGEGEYLINGQPCRLKDIKDLFRGTGVGVDAYSLIEQGKVDRMLQASARDRRAMFEEAAGISRFKAKKIEAERRLERVDQNLLRLHDIVEEVDNRLRNVRSQATKARRYREYSERLQQLRTQVGLTDWWRLARQLQELESELGRLHDEKGNLAAEVEAWEARGLELDVEITNAVESTRLSENQLARHREQILVRESASEQGHGLLRDLEDAVGRHQRQLAAMTGRVGDLQDRLRETSEGLREASQLFGRAQQLVTDHELASQELSAQIERLRTEREARRAAYVDNMRSAATLDHRLSGLESQLSGLQAIDERTRQRLAELEPAARACQAELQHATTQEAAVTEEVRIKAQAGESARLHLQSLHDGLAVKRQQLQATQQSHARVLERVAVLEELEQSHEGLAAGVREVLEQAREVMDGPLVDVQCLVADLLHVSVGIAPMIDVALGERAQHIVLSGESLLEAIQAGAYRPPGRVGFVCVRDDAASSATTELSQRAGVIGRADRLVACNPSHESLKRRLLGDTWFVESLSIALALRATAPHGTRFVTSDGELVESDGAVVIGPKLSTVGLVSRRSELRDAKAAAAELDQRLAGETAEVSDLDAQVHHTEVAVAQLSAECHELAGALLEWQSKRRALADRRENLDREQETVQQERAAAEKQRQSCVTEIATFRAESVELQAAVAAVETSLQEVERRIDHIERQRDTHAGEATTAKVELAKCEQRLETLRARMVQFEDDQRERARAIDEARSQLAQSLQRSLATRRELLRAASELAELYLWKEATARQVATLTADRIRFADERNVLAGQLQNLRRKLQKADEQQHQQELAAGNIRHEQRTLADRIREDYGIELASAATAPTAEEQQERAEVEREIDDLRRRLNNIGAVNMEALHELDDLEARHTSLSGQYRDLVQAKEALERIIQKINADSRRLFEETLEAIRQNFQTLYRKAFGGGRADLILEPGVDVLEAGVEIIATPPGKPSFNNSLLSGGEKALTAVALLLAIFEYRPSPFCVLDEVDAPFDEANIGRFIDVLRGFLGWTKFIIVTHSKKTMTAATTLYGVTMQESGVSKRVSVRFEDVSEDGHISKEAVQRSDSPADKDERGVA